MGLEAVVGEIQEKGRREADKIRQEGEREVGQILSAAQARVAGIKEAVEREVYDTTRKIIEQESSAAHLVVKRETLNAEKELLDEVFRSTLASLAQLPDTFHREVLKKLLAQAGREIKFGKVYCSRRDIPVVQQLIGENPALSGYRSGGEREIEGGIIVASDDGTVTIDLSYRTFLDRVWESGLKDASDILFH
jgi:V/A-type H+/Na+-transporting ATPase subunit E